MATVGVLALQGAFIEHIKTLRRLGVEAVEVRLPEQLTGLDALIIPGGESTTIGKLATTYGLLEPLRQFAREKPVWGTCAGMILLAKEIDGEPPHYPFMDMRVRRNAYGRQLGSFHATLSIPGLSADPVACVFIRAPWVEKVWGEAEILAEVGGRIVAVRHAV